MALAERIVFLLVLGTVFVFLVRSWLGGWRPQRLGRQEWSSLAMAALVFLASVTGAYALGLTFVRDDPPPLAEQYEEGWRNGWTRGCLDANGTACADPPEWFSAETRTFTAALGA